VKILTRIKGYCILKSVVFLLFVSRGAFHMKLKTRKILYLGSALMIMIVGALWGGRMVWSQTFGLPMVQTNQVTLLSNTIATLSGQVTPNGYQTTCWFEYGTTQSLGSQTPTQSIGSGYNPSIVSFTLSNLSAGTTYYYRLDAQNQYGTTQGQIVSFSTTGFSAGGSNTVGGLSVTTNPASSVSDTQATLNAYAQTVFSQNGGWFEYGTDPSSLTQQTPAVQVQIGNSYFPYTVSGLTPGTTYYFRAALQSSGNTTYGSVLSFQTSGSGYTYYQQPTYQQPTYTYTPPVSYQAPDASTPQYVYVPKYIYVNADGSDASYNNGYYNNEYYGNGAVSYSYTNGQPPAYTYPVNYSVSAFMPTQYPYGYAPYAQVTPQGTQYNYNSGQLAASIAGVASPNQVTVLVGFILLVSVIVVLGALAFKR